jgi:hypothetical protein
MVRAKKTAPKVEVVFNKAVIHKGEYKKTGDTELVTATQKQVMQRHGFVNEELK